MPGITIKSVSGAVLYEAPTAHTIKQAVEEAVSVDASLDGMTCLPTGEAWEEYSLLFRPAP